MRRPFEILRDWQRRRKETDADWMALAWIGIVPIVATVICLALSYRYGLAPLAALIPVVGVSVFAGMWTDKYEMTSAIAACGDDHLLRFVLRKPQ